MKNEPSKTVVRAWARLLRVHTQALGGVERALKDAGFPQLSWYDVLLELERAGDAGLRPFELERSLLLPQYGLSRLLDRMQAENLIERRACATDARGSSIHVTRQGRDLRRRMWPTYAAAISHAVGTRLTEAECAALEALLGKLLEPPQA